MAEVILPYGWPALQGQASTTIVYQGTMARVYSVPTDPRVDSQLFQRNLLSDLKRMVGAAGPWAKSAWKIIFGTKWSSVIYQMVKGDVEGYWSASLSFFDLQSSVWKDEWRASAPYQATFNDPGRIFFAIANMLYNWDEDHDGHNFYQPEPSGELGEDEAIWWRADLSAYGWQIIGDENGYIGNQDIRWNYVGAWTTVNGKKETATVGDYAEITFKNSSVQFWFIGDTDGAEIEIKADGGQIGIVDTNRPAFASVKWNDVYRTVKPRVYRLTHFGGVGEKVRNDRLFYSQLYLKIDVDRMVGSWQSYSSGGPWGSDKWKTTGAGERAIEFNFVGSYLYGLFDRDAAYGLMNVIIDGELFTALDLGFVDENTQSAALFGRLRYGLHHCRIEAATAKQINFYYFKILKSKKGLLV